MKVLLSLFLVLLVAISCASAATDQEIQFRNLPWNLDAVSFRDRMIEDIGTPYDLDTESGLWLFEHTLRDYNILDLFEPTLPLGNRMAFSPNGSVYLVQVSARDDVYVGGYPIKFVTGQSISIVENGRVYTSPEKSLIVSCSYSLDLDIITDPFSAAASLKSKLDSIYGNCDLEYFEDTYGAYAWLGANNTYVMLYYNNLSGVEGEGMQYFDIQYGLYNLRELLDIIEHPELTIDADSTDGL